MGSGSWSEDHFARYSKSVGRSYDAVTRSVVGSYSAQDMFKSHKIDESLDPMHVIRECCDSDEHPNTFPVVLGLDVTGSMGSAAVEVAKNLNLVMTDLYEVIPDVEFQIIAIGDLAYDTSPIQVSQFESDIRIAEQLDKVWFEGAGGGNSYESYTAAWYMTQYHASLDCVNKGRRGIIITMGDETLNPYLPEDRLKELLGVDQVGVVETSKLYEVVNKNFDIYHIHVDHGSSMYRERAKQTFSDVIGEQNFFISTVDGIKNILCKIIKANYEEKKSGFASSEGGSQIKVTQSGDGVLPIVSW